MQRRNAKKRKSEYNTNKHWNNREREVEKVAEEEKVADIFIIESELYLKVINT